MSLERLTLYSEPYGKSGNIGENFLRLLGAPGLDQFQTVIREALQNVADAALGGCGPEVVIRIRSLTDDQAAVLRSTVLGELPKGSPSHDGLLASLHNSNPVVMEICDFGTTGLGGPTRADRIPIDTTTTNFIDFMRNIGVPRDTGQGGGTYGFGKASLYQASRCRTIVVDTLATGGAPDARRLMGCHIGESFQVPANGMRRPYTGRHWWGVPDGEDGFVGPVVGSSAAELACQLGLPERPEGATGTSIMILDHPLQDEDMDGMGGKVVEAILWNFWPRLMTDTDPARRFTCRVEIEGRDVEVPPPETLSPFALFCRAMTGVRSGRGSHVRPIASQRPIKHLGLLAIEKGLRTPRHTLVSSDSIVPDVSHHIALMRPVELVVKYLEGAALPDERLEWAGVFVTSDDEDVERAFADSEPPAHDDWIPANMEKGPAKTYVKVALRELGAHAQEYVDGPKASPESDPVGTPLGHVAARLGVLLAGTRGSGAGPTPPSGGGKGGGGGPRARATRPVFLRLEQDGEGLIAVFATTVRQGNDGSVAVLRASGAIALDGGAASGLDGVVPNPTVLLIRGIESGLNAQGAEIAIGGVEDTFEIFVRVPRDCAVITDVELLVVGKAQ